MYVSQIYPVSKNEQDYHPDYGYISPMPPTQLNYNIPEPYNPNQKMLVLGNMNDPNMVVKPTPAKEQMFNNVKQLGFTDKLNTGTQLLGTVANAYLGYKQYKQAKEQLAFNKEQYHTNLNNQRKMVNSQLEDRQARRVRENLANGKQAGTSVADYMAKYGV